jgi:hypothetical protein
MQPRKKDAATRKQGDKESGTDQSKLKSAAKAEEKDLEGIES